MRDQGHATSKARWAARNLDGREATNEIWHAVQACIADLYASPMGRGRAYCGAVECREGIERSSDTWTGGAALARFDHLRQVERSYLRAAAFMRARCDFYALLRERDELDRQQVMQAAIRRLFGRVSAHPVQFESPGAHADDLLASLEVRRATSAPRCHHWIALMCAWRYVKRLLPARPMPSPLSPRLPELALPTSPAPAGRCAADPRQSLTCRTPRRRRPRRLLLQTSSGLG